MSNIRRVLFLCKEIFFPRFCVACKKEGAWMCVRCLPERAVVENFVFETGAATDVLHGLTAVSQYGENTTSTLVRILKYNYITDVLDDLFAIITRAEFSFSWASFVIVPVPLHPRRQRERGFNQAESIADLFAKKFNLAVHKNLQRAVYTKQQAMLSGDDRRKNLNGAFIFKKDGKQVPQSVLLVDDVFTTGSTMRECARALKAAGVKTVWGLVLAKG